MISNVFRAYHVVGRLPLLGRVAQTVARASGMSNLARWAILRRPAQVGGVRLYIDPRTNSAPMFGKGWNTKEESLVRSIISPGDAIIDVGANIGFFTVLCAQLAGPAGSVISVEPLPANVAQIKRNLCLNQIGNVRIVQAACGEREGTAQFKSYENNHAIGRLDSTGTLAVALTTLDSISNGPISFLKVDVEGSELHVMRGAQRLLVSSPNIKVMLEFDEDAYNRAGYSWRDLRDFMASYGLKPFDVRLDCRPFEPRRGTMNVLFRT